MAEVNEISQMSICGRAVIIKENMATCFNNTTSVATLTRRASKLRI